MLDLSMNTPHSAARKSLEYLSKHAKAESIDISVIDTLGISYSECLSLNRELNNHYNNDTVIKYLTASTSGYAYNKLRKINFEPIIPSIPDSISYVNQGYILDIGCSWGRWSTSLAKKYNNAIVVGIDPSLGAIYAASLLAKKLNVSFIGIVADARYLPFKENVFKSVFSYSVLQHFSYDDLEKVVGEVRNVCIPNGQVSIQIANALGFRSQMHLAKRRYKKPLHFDVRYILPWDIKKYFRQSKFEIIPECYFGLGLLKSDIEHYGFTAKIASYASKILLRLSYRLRYLRYFADSLWIKYRVSKENFAG